MPERSHIDHKRPSEMVTNRSCSAHSRMSKENNDSKKQATLLPMQLACGNEDNVRMLRSYSVALKWAINATFCLD